MLDFSTFQLFKCSSKVESWKVERLKRLDFFNISTFQLFVQSWKLKVQSWKVESLKRVEFFNISTFQLFVQSWKLKGWKTERALLEAGLLLGLPWSWASARPSIAYLCWEWLWCTKLYEFVFNYIKLYWIVLNCIKLYCSIITCIEFDGIVLHCIKLYAIAWNCLTRELFSTNSIKL